MARITAKTNRRSAKMTVSRSDFMRLLKARGLNPLAVQISEKVRGESAPAYVTIIFGQEGDSCRLSQALKASPWTVDQGRDDEGRYTVTLFGC